MCLDAWIVTRPPAHHCFRCLGLPKSISSTICPFLQQPQAELVIVACNNCLTSTLAVKGAAARNKELTWYTLGLLPQERGKGGTPLQATNQSLEYLQCRQLCAPAGRTCTNSHVNVVQ